MGEQEKGYTEIKKEAVEKLKEAVDLLLMEENDEGYTKLYMLIQDKNIRELCRLDNKLYIVMRLVTLWDKERKAERENNIFDNVQTLDDAVELYKNIIFSIYRLEQVLPLIYQDEAIQYISNIAVSPIVLCSIATDKVIDEQMFYTNLLEGLNRNGALTLRNEIEAFRRQIGAE